MASNGETVDTTVQTGGSFMRVFTRWVPMICIKNFLTIIFELKEIKRSCD